MGYLSASNGFIKRCSKLIGVCTCLALFSSSVYGQVSNLSVAVLLLPEIAAATAANPYEPPSVALSEQHSPSLATNLSLYPGSSPSGFDSGNAISSSDDESKLSSEDVPKKDNAIESGQKVITRSYMKAVTATDNFFSGRALENEINDSYLKLETKYTYYTNEAASGGVSLKGRVDLPKTENKMRFFFDTDDDLNHSLEERNRSVSTGERVTKQNSIFGMELSPSSELNGWKVALRLGVRMEDVPRALTKIHVRKRWALSEKWSFNVRNDLWYLAANGPGNTARFELANELSETMRLRFISEIEYRDQFQTTDYLFQTVLSQTLSKRSNIYYRIGGLSGHDEAEPKEKLFVSLNYRRQTYKDWVYFSIIPEIFAEPYEQVLEEHFSLTAKLEFFFVE